MTIRMGGIQTCELLPVPGINAELGQVLREKSFDLFPNFIELCECAHEILDARRRLLQANSLGSYVESLSRALVENLGDLLVDPVHDVPQMRAMLVGLAEVLARS